MRYGWQYLVVTHTTTELPAIWHADGSGVFASEAEMFRELGATGWELVALRTPESGRVYYFKRPRA